MDTKNHSTPINNLKEHVLTPSNMDELVKYIHMELGDRGLTSSEVDINRLTNLMENYQSNPQHWEKYAHFDPYKLTRNLVDDGNGEFNLIVICWGEGQKSPIHDHAGSHCIMKMLEGELTEQKYDWPETDHPQKMTNTFNCNFNKDDVTYVDDKKGIHRVGNFTNKNAISLHLYSPPIKYSVTFQEQTGQMRPPGKVVFHSINGIKV